MKRPVLIKIGVSAALLIAAVSVIIYTALQSEGLFRFVDEVRAESKSLKGREMWMAGTLEPGTHEVRTNAQSREEHRFYLSHKGARIAVHFVGSMPGNAMPGQQIVVRGKLTPNLEFSADEVRTKCPSKYKAQYEARK